MEKIKIGSHEYEIMSIDQRGNLLKITFPNTVTLKGDLSKIELYTAGGVYCTTFTGYTTIYNASGTTITLSKDKTTSPDPDPVPGDQSEAPPAYNVREEIEALKAMIASTDTKAEVIDLQAYTDGAICELSIMLSMMGGF